jgi:hypothetical protein
MRQSKHDKDGHPRQFGLRARLPLLDLDQPVHGIFLFVNLMTKEMQRILQCFGFSVEPHGKGGVKRK